jgi:hypothetical protein
MTCYTSTKVGIIEKKMNKKLIFGFAAAAIFMSAAAAFAADGTSSATSTKPQSAVNIACVQSAVGKREAAVAAAFDAYSAAEKSALSARSSALSAAWGKTNLKDVRIAVKSSWKAYNDAQKAARKTLRQATQGAWKQFNTDRKSCGKGAGDEEIGGQGADINL